MQARDREGREREARERAEREGTDPGRRRWRRRFAGAAVGVSVLSTMLAVGPLATSPAAAGPGAPLGIEQGDIAGAIAAKGGSMVDCTVPHPGSPTNPPVTVGTTPAQAKGTAGTGAGATRTDTTTKAAGGVLAADGRGDVEGGKGPVRGGGSCAYKGPTPGTTERGTNPITDALGVRFDQRALDEVTPQMAAPVRSVLIAKLQQAGVESAPLGDFPLQSTTATTGPVTVTGDFRAPDSTFPTGSLKIHIDVQDPEIAYAVDPLIWDDCHIWIRPGDFTIDAVATYNASAPVPLSIASIDTDIDMNPQGNISTSGMCWTYLIDNVIGNLATSFWNFITFHIWDNPSDPVAELKTTLMTQVNTALGNLWNGQVLPALMPAGGAITLADVRSDDEGLKVKVDVDPALLSFLITSPGQAVDAGTASDLDAVLGERDTTEGFGTDLSAVIDPNFLNVLLAHLANAKTYNFAFGLQESDLLSSGLLKASAAGTYADDTWSLQFLENQVPFLKATPHAPASNGNWDVQSRLTVPSAELSVRNDGNEVARVQFTAANVGVGVQTHMGTGRWGLAADLNGASVNGVSMLYNNGDFSAAGAAGFVGSKVDQAVAWLDGLTFAPPQIAGYMAVPRMDQGSLAGDDRVTGLFDLELGPTVRLDSSVGSWKAPKKIDGYWHFYPSYEFTGVTTGLTNVTWTFTNPSGTFATWTITGNKIVINTEGFCGYGGTGSVDAHVTGTWASSAGPLVINRDLSAYATFDPATTGLCGPP